MSSGTREVVAIFGPTASGKTQVAAHLARQLGTEVVNCDPAQCYRGLPILTNQPSEDELRIAPHQLVGVWDLTQTASVHEYTQLAHDAIDELVRRTGYAVITGGSGLYMRAALSDMVWGGADRDEGLRRQFEQLYDTRGAFDAHLELQSADPRAARNIHPHDRKRVVRALEAAATGGSVAPGETGLWEATYRHPTRVFALAASREQVHARIEQRTAAMFANGVVAEVAAHVGQQAEHLDRLSTTARKIHGVSDCVAVLRGELSTGEAARQLVIRTRQYARRQDTWARRWPGVVRVPVDQEDAGVDIATLVATGRAQGAVRQVARPR